MVVRLRGGIKFKLKFKRGWERKASSLFFSREGVSLRRWEMGDGRWKMGDGLLVNVKVNVNGGV